jgi:cyclopropane-fatty-acyl-phospholipid synthase
MSFVAAATGAVERWPLPDPVLRLGIRLLVGRMKRKLTMLSPQVEEAFVHSMSHLPIAHDVRAANRQHYELPPEFFALSLGPRRKYSCCFYATGAETLAQAEDAALAQTISHAGLEDGQSILELGCGWGSLTLLMAERFPNASIIAVSNSNAQRRTIVRSAALRGLSNVTVLTADMNGFSPSKKVDRIVSVEMFEHMANWHVLLRRAREWLHRDGRLFVHVFSHRTQPYRFDTSDREDWIAQHFFTGGLMPSHGLLSRFGDIFQIEREWRWDGTHYQRTALDWLRNFDANCRALERILEDTYGPAAALWQRRWRLFFLSTAGLFGYAGGREWGVSHYTLKPVGP